MKINRVKTETGSHIEPPLDQDWPEWKRLDWHAAVVSADTGLPIRIAEATFSTKRFGRWRVDPDAFSINYGHGSVGAYSFNECWAALSALSIGVELARRAAS